MLMGMLHKAGWDMNSDIGRIDVIRKEDSISQMRLPNLLSLFGWKYFPLWILMVYTTVR
jgi:hypothetical protein